MCQTGTLTFLAFCTPFFAAMALPTAPIVLTAPTEAVRAGSALHATRTTRSTIVDRARHDQRTWRSGLTAVAAAGAEAARRAGGAERAVYSLRLTPKKIAPTVG